MVYFPPTGLAYYFTPSGPSSTAINALNPLSRTTAVVTTFNFTPGPLTLGGAHPTLPFEPDLVGGLGASFPNGIYNQVVSAAVSGDAVYLGCQDHSGVRFHQFGTNGVKSLVRFFPLTGATELVHGPFQSGNYRHYLHPQIINGIYYLFVLDGYYGDTCAPGFITALGGALFYSTGAQIFRSLNGDADSWRLVYDGLGQQPYLIDKQTYGRHHPGTVDPTGSLYLFGATGEKVTATQAQDVLPTVFLQAQPYTVDDTTNPFIDGPAVRTIPICPVGMLSIGTIFPGYAVDLDRMVAGLLTHQPVSRAVMGLDAGGNVSVVYEDTREDVDIGRAEMGQVKVIWDGDNADAGLAAMSSGWTDWTPVSAVPPIVPTFGNSGGGWSNDPISHGIFKLNSPFFDTIPPSVPFAYGGKLYALHFAGQDIGTQLLVRDSAGAWSVVVEPFGLGYDFFRLQECNLPFSVVSTKPHIRF